MKFIKLVDASLVIIIVYLILSDLCSRVEFIIYRLLINNFGRPSLGHHYYIIPSLSDPCTGVGNKSFKEIHQFDPKLSRLRMQFIHLTISYLSTLKMLNTKFGEDSTVVLELLMDDAR